MTRGDLLALADRVEALRVGGSFAVDTEIAYALNLPLEGIAKPYTASLDAAMTLVPDGWRLWTGDFSVQGRFVWMLVGPVAPWIDPEDEREYMTPQYVSGIATAIALALTTAALRARALDTPAA